MPAGPGAVGQPWAGGTHGVGRGSLTARPTAAAGTARGLGQPAHLGCNGCRGASPGAPACGDPGGANLMPCPTAGLPPAGTVPEEGIPALAHPGWGAGTAIATQLRTAPSSPPAPPATHGTAATAPETAGVSPPQALGCRTDGCLSFPLHNATVGPWGGGPQHTLDTIDSPRPGLCHPGCCPLVPLRRDGPATQPRGTATLSRARRHGGGWLWGGRSLSQRRHRHTSWKTSSRAVADSSCPNIAGTG